MANKGEETEDNIGGSEKGDVGKSEKDNIDWNKKFSAENMSPEDLLKWIPFMLGRRAMPSKEEMFSDISSRVDDFSNYVTSTARLFKLETMVYLQVGFNMFINGVDSLIVTTTLDEPKERLVLGILEGAMAHIQNKIDDIKMRREQRIKKESSSELN